MSLQSLTQDSPGQQVLLFMFAEEEEEEGSHLNMRGLTEGRQKFNQNLNHISKRWDLLLWTEECHIVKVS